MGRTKKHGRNVIKANRRRNSIPPALKKKFKEQDKRMQQLEKRDRIYTIIFYIALFLVALFCVALTVFIIFLGSHG